MVDEYGDTYWDVSSSSVSSGSSEDEGGGDYWDGYYVGRGVVRFDVRRKLDWFRGLLVSKRVAFREFIGGLDCGDRDIGVLINSLDSALFPLLDRLIGQFDNLFSDYLGDDGLGDGDVVGSD